ncbi:MAG TPA: flagellar M-ring protein FliF [Firmicutes bacterium]|nr:flagellar M-ring protein FliF [Bacillota bacterium]
MAKFLEQLKQIWLKLDKQKRLFLIGGTLLFLVAFSIFVYQISRVDYELLYGNLSQIEQDEIIGSLREMNIPYRKGKDALYVPNASEVRAELMKAGIPKGGIVGWEIFDRTSLGTTHFLNQVNYQRALQNEIRRTLREIDGILDAHVILDLPDQEPVFWDEVKPPSAAITLKLVAPDILSPRQISAIANLVAGTIVGMSVENITIIDNYANDLTELMQEKEVPSSTSWFEDQYAARRALEKDLEKSLERLLGKAFGLRQVAARVSVEMNFDQQEIKKETFGTRGVPRSEQEISEAYEGQGGVRPLGIPGTDSNITEYRFGDDQEAVYSREERIVNYEIDRIEEHLIKTPGRVERISVALLIGQELSPALQARIEELTGTAVGYDMARGDTISVVSMPFAEPEVLHPETAPFSWQTVLSWAALVLILALGAVFAWRMLVPARRPPAVDMVVGDEEEEAAAMEEEELSVEEKKRRQRQEFLQKLAKEKPEDVAALLKTWILED